MPVTDVHLTANGVGTGAEDASAVIAAAQDRLRRVPSDSQAWAGLALAYVQQAKTTADPSYYPKADGALARSLKEMPAGNAPALAGMATVAAARHDFAGALRLAEQAEVVDSASSTVQGVKGDALVELGRYDEAYAAFQKMVDLKPGVPSYTRASYAWELRGDITQATAAMELALEAAFSPADKAYAQYYLGELSWNSGDIAGALKHDDDGLKADPTYVPLLAGRAKASAALGDNSAALRDYAQVVQKLPQPSYLIEYGDLLASLGRTADAATQFALVGTEEQLFAGQGVDVDLELALFDADHGQPAKALTEATAELAKRHSILVEDAYAWALHVNGRDAEALPHAQAATRLGLHDALLYFHRGMIEKSVGDAQAAATDLRQALTLNPHFSTQHAPEATAALAQLAAR